MLNIHFVTRNLVEPTQLFRVKNTDGYFQVGFVQPNDKTCPNNIQFSSSILIQPLLLFTHRLKENRHCPL